MTPLNVRLRKGGKVHRAVLVYDYLPADGSAAYVQVHGEERRWSEVTRDPVDCKNCLRRMSQA